MRLLVAILLVAFLAGPALPAEGKAQVGKPAPPFHLQAANVGKVLPGKKDGDTLSLADLKGKNVVLFFFPKAMTRG